MLYATRYQGAEDVARQNAAYNRAMKQQQYDLDVQKHGTEQQKIAINQYETHINNAMKSLDKNPLLTADPVARAAAEDKILNGPTARSLYRRAYGNMQMESPSFAGFSATERKK
jgi:citrate lyase synthetase